MLGLSVTTYYFNAQQRVGMLNTKNYVPEPKQDSTVNPTVTLYCIVYLLLYIIYTLNSSELLTSINALFIMISSMFSIKSIFVKELTFIPLPL